MKRGGPITPNPEKVREWQQRSRKPLPAMSTARRAGTAERAAVRRAVFERDRWACQLKDRTPNDCHGVLTVHHLRKASAGGPYTADNLVALCAGCNVWVEDNPAAARKLGMVRR